MVLQKESLEHQQTRIQIQSGKFSLAESSLVKRHRSLANTAAFLFILKRFGGGGKKHQNLNRKKINLQGLFSLLLTNTKINLEAACLTVPPPQQIEQSST